MELEQNIIDCSIDHGFEPVLDAREDRGARRVRAVQVDDGVGAAVSEAEAKFLGCTYWNWTMQLTERMAFKPLVSEVHKRIYESL